MKRREFLQSSALASSALLVPNFLKAFQPTQLMKRRSGKVLVVIQLSGGNDSLNTIIPYRNDIYYQNRPKLAIPSTKVIQLADELGSHPSLSPLRPLYDQGDWCILNSVGYPNPDRSHFRSMDIWHTASSESYLSTGWLGRYLDSNCDACVNPYQALEVDDNLSLALKGGDRNGFAMGNPNQLKRLLNNRFFQKTSKIAAQDHEHEHENAAYLYKTIVETQSSARYLYDQSKVHSSKIDYPQQPFARDLKQIAELMTADTDTRIYYLSLGGFDTHVNQANQQSRLLKLYAEGVAAFVKDLKQNGLFDDTLIMTFSEFGRRVKQNASNGTDHGTAGSVFLMGGQLKQAGFYNGGPDLANLEKGDLRYQIDFRRIYADILNQWLEADASAILGQSMKGLQLL